MLKASIERRGSAEIVIIHYRQQLFYLFNSCRFNVLIILLIGGKVQNEPINMTTYIL